MVSMFYRCVSLKANKTITEDNAILKSFYKNNDKDNNRCFII